MDFPGAQASPRSWARRLCTRLRRPLALVPAFVLAGLPCFIRSAGAQVLRENLYVTDGFVNTTVMAGGVLYVGGSFSQVGPAMGGAIPLDATTGIPQAIPRVAGSVNAVAPDGSGGWFIGGWFSHVGGLPRSNLAHIQSDFSVSGWNPGANGTVRALLVRGGAVYVGGDFTSVGGDPGSSRLAAVDRTTGDPRAWHPGANGPVFALAAHGGTVIAGGNFTSFGGLERNNLGAVDTLTAFGTSWLQGTNGQVSVLAVSGDRVYAGGEFTQIIPNGKFGNVRHYCAAFSVDGGLLEWDPDADGIVTALRVSDGVVYAGGEFTSIGGQSRNGAATLDLLFGTAGAWNPAPNGTVYALALSGGEVYLGGDFTTVGGQSRNRIAAVDSSTALATSWNPNASQGVRAIAAGGGTVFAGGFFSFFGGLTRRNLAAFDIETGLPTAWDPNPDNQVRALALDGGKVYAGGDFLNIGGEGRDRIAALDATTGLATPWDPGADFGVAALIVGGGTLYAAGSFTTIGGQPRSRIAALDTASAAATAWNPGANNVVSTLASGGSVIYAGGSFTNIGGQARNRIAALDVGSGVATAWSPSASAAVLALVANGPVVYAGGQFTTIGGQARSRIAALDVATGLATAWNPGADGSVNALAPSGGKILAGGAFSSIGGAGRFSLAELDTASGLATPWNPAVLGGSVSTVATEGGIVAFGGNFVSAAGRPRTNVGAVGPVQVSIGDAALVEGASGTTNANFTVRIPTPMPGAVTVQYQTQDGSATVADNDYTGASGIATIPANDTTVVVPIAIKGDLVHEPDQTFTVTISAPSSNAVIFDGIGQGTIANDDPVPALTIQDVQVGEPRSGATIAVLTVALSHASDQQVSVDYEAQEGSATLANNDYVHAAGTLVVPSRGMSAGVLVTVNGDLVFEDDEVFTVALSNPLNATIADGIGECTIRKVATVRPDLCVTNDGVASAVLIGNSLYISGNFTQVGPNTGCGVPIDAVTGLPVPGFPPVARLTNDPVYIEAVIPDGAGGWYIGGVFSSVGGKPVNNLAHIRSDHSVADWNLAPNASVKSLVLSGNTLYVAGVFNTIGGQSRSGVAAVDTATGAVTAWNPGASGPGAVYALAVAGGTVYAAGNFTNIGGQARNRIAALDAATGAATAWNPNASDEIRALAVTGGTVYAGGNFTTIGGQARSRIAALDATTGLATGWNPSADQIVLALLADDSTVWVGGAFTIIGGQARNRVAAVDATSGLSTAWDPNVSGHVNVIARAAGTIYVGGNLNSVGGQARSNLAAIDSTTGLVTAWNPRAGGFVLALAASGGTVYAGGLFNIIGGEARNRLAAVDVTTGDVTPWNPGVTGVYVGPLVAHGNTILVGGFFTSIGGQPRNNLAALDATTGLATAWNPGTNDWVRALAASAGTVYVAGDFTFAGGQSRNRIAAVDAATGLATGWNPDVSWPDGQLAVVTLALDGNTVYAGGWFTSIGGQSRNRIAALDATTGLATAWNPDANDYVSAIEPRGGVVYVGGAFTSVGGQSRSRIAALDAATGLATAWSPDANGVVTTLATDINTVYASGSFFNIGGQPRSRIAALDALTGLASPWNPGASPGHATSIVVTDTTIYVAGGFVMIAGSPIFGLAALGPMETPPTLAIGDVDIQEGQGGVTNATFTISLSQRTAFPVTVDYQTYESTATTANNDFTVVSGTAAIDPKTLSGTVTVPVHGDSIQEGDETFTLRLTNAVNAVMIDSIATGTILNDDGTPSLSIHDVSIAEGDTGSVSAVFTVKLSHPTDQPVSVLYQTLDGSATVADSDYVAVSDTVVIAAKSDSVTLSVTVTGDLTFEPDETFTVVLSDPVNATIADSSATGTIVNDEPDTTPPGIPAPFTGVFSGGPVQLHWGANTEPDFASYHLHRDSTEDFVPGPGNLVVSQPDTGYVDAGSTWSYYKLSALDLTGNQSGFALLVPSGQASGATPAGSNVPVSLASNVQLTFQNVTSGGVSELTMQTGGQPPPNGLKLAPGSPKLYYLLTTTASFTGAVTVCVTYDPANVSGQESNLKMMHYDTLEQPPGWVEVTASRDVEANVICGTVTHFSEFALMEPLNTVDVREALPTALLLHPCAPNPVRGAARFWYDLPVASPVRLEVFDLQGRRVRNLEHGSRVDAGRHMVSWDGRGAHGEELRAGIYFLRLDAMGSRQVRRFVVTR